jgi:hypothetical protein
MRHHPARRARTVTAVASAAAFAGITTGLVVTHAGAATHPASAQTPAPATGTDGTSGFDGGSASTSTTLGQSPDDGSDGGWGWTATPGQDVGPSSGSSGTTHGQSGPS